MAAGTHTWMKNAETGGVWECPAEYVETAEARGWEVTDAPVDDVPEDEAPVSDPAKPRTKKRSTNKTGD